MTNLAQKGSRVAKMIQIFWMLTLSIIAATWLVEIIPDIAHPHAQVAERNLNFADKVLLWLPK
jgi:hypothetical protein